MNALQTLVDGIADAAFASEPGGRVVAWNAGAERMLGVPAARAVGAGCAELLRGHTREGVTVCTPQCPMLGSGCAQPASGMVPAHPDLSVRRADGGRVDVSVVAVPMVVDGASVLVHLLRDHTLDDTDPLTGCLRPWSFEPRAVTLQDHAAATGRPLVAALVVIDDLAAVEREHGRSAANRAVAGVGTYLRYGLRDDAVCRWSGDEFALVLPGMSTAEAADRLRRSLAIVREHVRAGDDRVTFSAGVVPVDPSRPLRRALHRADVMLATSRAAGPGRVLTASP
jgi:diguanylate cyclase (GGDEF)-like protein